MKYKWYIMIELTFLKEFMLPKQVKQKIFITVSIFSINDLSFNHMYAIDAMIY